MKAMQMIFKNFRQVWLLLLILITLDCISLSARTEKEAPLPDFTYLLASGKEGTLWGISADYTLIYLNNTDCDICRHLSDSLAASPVISRMVGLKTLTVLGLYPDSDTAAWKARPTHLLPAWINACDVNLSVVMDDRYDVKHIPSLYLLDRQKKFLLKDVSVRELERFLQGKQK